MRFVLRKDLDPSSLGTCHIEEMRDRNPHGCDVLLIAKKHMADCDPVRVICLVSAEMCAALRSCVQQPTGNVPRRPIGAKAYQNITSKVPPCSKQGCITKEAHAYLMAWVEGTQSLLRRPLRYRFLELCRYPLDPDVAAPAAGARWQAPARFRIYTLLPTDLEESEDDPDEGPV